MAAMMSVDLSMTMTAAVPRPLWASLSASKSMSTLSQMCLGSRGTEDPPASARPLGPDVGSHLQHALPMRAACALILQLAALTGSNGRRSRPLRAAGQHGTADHCISNSEGQE